MLNPKSRKPLIGIVPDYKEGCANGYSKGNYYALRTNYVEMINKAGGAAVILTYDYDLIDDYLASLDGLMIVGGYFDIHPKRYGETKIHPAVKLNDVRENFEHELGARALGLESGSDRPKKFEEMARRASSEEGVYQNIHDRQAAQAQQSQNSNFTGRLPLLGICNGMQLINVLHGGSAIQHIPDEEKFMDHEQSHIKGFDDYHRNYHEVVIEKNSQLFAIIGEEKIQTNSSHHQAAKKDGQGLNVCAHASDGIIEAVEKINHPFCIGIQWHPEFDNSQADKKIFEGFVEAAKKYKKSK